MCQLIIQTLRGHIYTLYLLCRICGLGLAVDASSVNSPSEFPLESPLSSSNHCIQHNCYVMVKLSRCVQEPSVATLLLHLYLHPDIYYTIPTTSQNIGMIRYPGSVDIRSIPHLTCGWGRVRCFRRRLSSPFLLFYHLFLF